MVVSKLSVINAMENLPVCTQEAAFILCVSPECADMVAMQVRKERRYGFFKTVWKQSILKGSSDV